jgi:hypothetical protein
MKTPLLASELLTASLLYAERQGEREEILKHKWLESEKVGHDIGFDFASVDWRLKHRPRWSKAWRDKHLPSRLKN